MMKIEETDLSNSVKRFLYNIDIIKISDLTTMDCDKLTCQPGFGAIRATELFQYMKEMKITNSTLDKNLAFDVKK